MRRKHWLRKSGLGLGLGIGGGVIGYLVNDQFINDVTAGNFAGAALYCVPGPGKRAAVNDSGPIMSISSGILTNSAAATGAGDPRMLFTQSDDSGFVREQGRMVIVKHRTVSAAGALTGSLYGWFKTNPPANVNDNEGLVYWYNASAGSSFNYGAGHRGRQAIYNSDTWAKEALILRTTGCFYLNYDNGIWYLEWREESGATATLYPGKYASAAGRYEDDVDYINIPILKMSVRPVLADTFDRANGALAGSTTDGGGTTGLETGGNGIAWVSSVGTWATSTNAAVCSILDGGIGIATIESGKTDVYLTVNMNRTGNEIGVVCNYHDANNYIRAYHDGTNINFQEVVAGAPNNLFVAVAAAYQANAAIVVKNKGNAYRVYYNNSYIGSGTVTNATIRAATKVGLYSTNVANYFNGNFFCYARGSGKEYDYLNALSTGNSNMAINGYYLNNVNNAVAGNGKTFVGYLNGSNVFVASIAGSVVTNSPILATLETDDHDSPTLYLRTDGRIAAFYTYHALANKYVYCRISTNPYDVSAWGAEINIGALGAYTYTQPVYLAGESKLYLFTRGVADVFRWSYATSSDEGETWSAFTELVNDPLGAEQLYFLTYADATTIHFCACSNPNGGTSDIRYMKYTGGSFYKADGTLIGAVGDLPFEIADLEMVYDHAGVGNNTALISGIMAESGSPRILFTYFPDVDNHWYAHAYWNGAAWAISNIANGGGSPSETTPGDDYYSGGLIFDRNNINKIYYSTDSGLTQFEIYSAITADNGATWASSALTSSSAAGDNTKNFRPTSVLNASGIDVMWLHGRFPSFTGLTTNIVKS